MTSCEKLKAHKAAGQTEPSVTLRFPRRPKPSEVYDSFWAFAYRRQEVYHARLQGRLPPWTEDGVIAAFRFTNVYRASDRVSQHLIRDVIYSKVCGPRDLFLRVMLFKLFNRWGTWQLINRTLGDVYEETFHVDQLDKVLELAISGGERLYSAAYIMPTVREFGGGRKHTGHLKLVSKMLSDRLPERIQASAGLRDVFEMLAAYSGLGPFLAFQYAIDLNYSPLINFSENDFVVAGPGALDGLRKCFADPGGLKADELIRWVCERQEEEFQTRGLAFRPLFGRPLHLIDCQNLFCEVDKYARVRHPSVAGRSGRTRIKQGYTPIAFNPIPRAFFPPKWGLDDAVEQFYEGRHEIL